MALRANPHTPRQARISPKQRLPADATAQQREAIIRLKYEKRAFVRDAPALAPDALCLAALADDVPAAAAALARGADFEARGPSGSVCDSWTADVAATHAGRTALQICAAEGNERVLELLLQNGACVDAEDHKGRTALRIAVGAAAEGCMAQLLTRGANISHADHSHQSPMQAATELGHDELAKSMLAYKLAQDEKLLATLPAD